MKIDEHFKTRISMARQAIGLTQSELADSVGVVRRQIAAYEAGDSKPRDKVLVNLAAVLGTSVDWLSSGVGSGPDLKNVRKTTTIPLIPLYHFGHPFFLEPNDSHAPDDLSPVSFITALSEVSDNAFALEMLGDSMESTGGVSFCEGTIITFEPIDAAAIGDFILVSDLIDGSIIFRQVIKDQGNWYLRPLNNLYKTIKFDDNMTILGIATHAQYSMENLYVKFPHNENHHPSPQSNPLDLEKRLNRIESMLEQLLNKKAP
ncbi:XRE family transcriptional regulator [Xenorhabdus bovienii]|uniref:helix-turn-helix domain-containing protein n=1 Tax=Xenorhabdus bovienii TaxID=40576 RepID=UPI0023B25E41|nr:XRE family transcriptional regulator [Xenorhabdus bovienii]MDE9443025.1 XRE family transcriptional regulator [Xenorhabdus bovienii]